MLARGLRHRCVFDAIEAEEKSGGAEWADVELAAEGSEAGEVEAGDSDGGGELCFDGVEGGWW